MAYLTDMPGVCRARSTNPEYALELLKSISGEFDKSFGGGIFDPSYVLSKLETLTRHVKWLEGEAEAVWASQFGSIRDPKADPLPVEDEDEDYSPDELDDPDFYAPGGGFEGGS